MPVTHTRVVYEGDDNPKLKQIGAAVLCFGLLVMLLPLFGVFKTDLGSALGSFFFGMVVMMMGGLIARLGAIKRTIPCPHCRVRIAPSASICPQCHMATTGQGVLVRRA